MLKRRTVACPLVIKGVVNGVCVNVALPAKGSGTGGVVLDIESVGTRHLGAAKRSLGLAAAAAAGVEPYVSVEDLCKLIGKRRR